MVATYVQRFARLHSNTNAPGWTDATRGRAPHKPLLLLAVLDLFAEGAITANLVELTPDLGELFSLYWWRVMPPGRRGNIALPFFHLKSDGFWHLMPQPGKEAILEASRQIHSTTMLREMGLGARLDDDLYALMCVEESHALLRTVLIDTYFSLDVQPLLWEQGVTNVDAYHYSEALLARARQVAEAVPDKDPYRPAARDQGFRRAVATAYAHRCGLCGLRVQTPDGHTAVQAGHIIPWSISHDDDPRNGMGLCPLCHWTFDEGLCGVSARYTILVSPQLRANDNLPGHLLTLEGREIVGPAEQPLWPRLEALHWHRGRVFRAH